MPVIYDWKCDLDMTDVDVPEGVLAMYSEDVDGLHTACIEATLHVRAATDCIRHRLGLSGGRGFGRISMTQLHYRERLSDHVEWSHGAPPRRRSNLRHRPGDADHRALVAQRVEGPLRSGRHP